ncbi:MAG: hypothetical protein KME27_12470 [Lyngbya sp. HA4199-MV5]|jgi:hypothetical protein|nr:hypothetical protein [Lyngbya sp. HA4199-MV5]
MSNAKETSNRPQPASDTSDRVESDVYDRGIVPAETAARKEREGAEYKTQPKEDNPDSVQTDGGYTVDKEGLLNNYAVEPEMYYETPGDARQPEDEPQIQEGQGPGII